MVQDSDFNDINADNQNNVSDSNFNDINADNQVLHTGISKNISIPQGIQNIGNQITQGIVNTPGGIINSLGQIAQNAGTTVNNISQQGITPLQAMNATDYGLLNSANSLGSGVYNIPGTFQNAWNGNNQIPMTNLNLQKQYYNMATNPNLQQQQQQAATKYPLINNMGEMTPNILTSLLPGGTGLAANTGLGFIQGSNNGLSNAVSGGLGNALMQKAPELSDAILKGTAPTTANILAGIPKEDTQTALNAINNGEDFFAGKWDKNTVYQPVIDKINNAIQEATPPDVDFSQQYKQLGLQAKQFADKYFHSDSDYAKVIQSIASKLNESYKNAEKIYGQAVGRGAESLKDEEDVPLSTINRILMEEKNKYGKSARNISSDLVNSRLSVMKEYAYENLKNNPKFQEIVNTWGVSPNDLIQLLKENPNELEMWGLDKSDLKVKKYDLHQEKRELQQQIGYNGQYKDSSQIGKNIASRFNDILRENNNYAKFNDAFSKLEKFIDENSWLKKTSSTASRLNNAHKSSGQLNNTLNTIKDFEKITNQNGMYSKQIEDLLNKQQTDKEFENSISKSMLRDISKYDDRSASLEQKDAIERLNDASPNKFLDQYKALKNQEEIQQKKIDEQKELKKEFYKKNIINNPDKILKNGKDDLHNAYQELDNNASSQNKFMNDLNLLKARQSFESIKPNHSNAITIASHAGLTPFSIISSLHGRPEFALAQGALGAIMSPLAHKFALGGYRNIKNVSPYLPRIQSSTLQPIQKNQK